MLTPSFPRTHVVNDLDAYVCLFDECDKPEELYTRSSDWLNHMHAHTLRWRCNSKPHGTVVFPTQEQYLDHMRHEHSASFTEPQLRVLAERNGRPIGPMFDFCPICGTDEVITSLEEHIIGHLRLLALRSLPAYEDEGSDLSEDDRISAGASKPASRTTIKDDPERHTRPTFQDSGEPSKIGNKIPNRLLFSQYQQWGGYKNYITGQPKLSGVNESLGLDFTPPEINGYGGRRPSPLIGEHDHSELFVDLSLFNGIPQTDVRRFEWGFLTEAGDAQLESHGNDVIIQSMLISTYGFSLAEVDQKTITSSQLEDDDSASGSRSQHEEVFCSLCHHHPEGFRGNVDLYRHIEGNHKDLINGYICVDPSASGSYAKITPSVPLEDCAACDRKWRYLTEYDAFAHLRATHFLNVKPQPTNFDLQRWHKVIIRNHRRYAADPKGAVQELMELASEALGASMELNIDLSLLPIFNAIDKDGE